jgi:hypothetical protein
MIRDDNTLYLEDELTDLGIPSDLIWEAREKGLLNPYRPGMKRLQFLGREVCAAIIALSAPVAYENKTHRSAKYSNATTITKPSRVPVSD